MAAFLTSQRWSVRDLLAMALGPERLGASGAWAAGASEGEESGRCTRARLWRVEEPPAAADKRENGLRSSLMGHFGIIHDILQEYPAMVLLSDVVDNSDLSIRVDSYPFLWMHAA
jgi:hypothetical protein